MTTHGDYHISYHYCDNIVSVIITHSGHSGQTQEGGLEERALGGDLLTCEQCYYTGYSIITPDIVLSYLTREQ